jgi:2-oxoglutarate dehydrogenase E2 component (dihydrolipoamide succinyltransferase)
MSVDIKVPSVGESITEGTLSRWFKKDGDAVRAEEPLFELETEKATTEIAAPATGILHITTQEGQKLAIGSVVGRIEESAEGGGKQPVAKAKPKQAKTDGEAAPKPLPSKPPTEKPRPPEQKEASPAPAIMPAARRLAEESGTAVADLTGTGRGGRITKEDVQARVSAERSAQSALPSETAPGAPRSALRAPRSETRRRMSSIRQRIAERLVAAQHTTASLTTFNEADMSAVITLRNQYKDRFKETHGVGLGFMSFFVKAVVEALQAYPLVNSRIDGADVVEQHFYDIGIAVSSERGLMVPVLRDADGMSFADIEKKIAELADKARQGKITVQDLQGGTFTITNGGIFGSLLSTPILNPPQSAILGMHTIQKRTVVINDQIAVRPMMYIALTYDHRLIDGREAVLFLVRVKECIENPERLLLEV